MNIHENYDQLTSREKSFVDETFSVLLFARASKNSIPLHDDDTSERAVDAFAKWVIESRVAVTEVNANNFLQHLGGVGLYTAERGPVKSNTYESWPFKDGPTPIEGRR